MSLGVLGESAKSLFASSPNMLRYFPRSLRGRLNPFHVFSDNAERMKNVHKEIFAFNNAWGL